MRSFRSRFQQLSLWVLAALNAACAHSTTVKTDESIIFFPTNAYLDPQGQWQIPLHGWIFEYENDSAWRNATISGLKETLELNSIEGNDELFKQRAWMFLVDNERGKQIKIKLADKTVTTNKSEPNGHFTGRAVISSKAIPDVEQNRWLSYQAKLKAGDSRVFRGEVQLLAPMGVSIISDIDDTIKDSNVGDKKELLNNTFLRPFKAVDGMAKIYSGWHAQGAAFHYLSASPWQLFVPLQEFIADEGFPKGSFHLRYFRIKDSSFFKLFQSPEEYKTGVLEQIIKQYPQRKFVLVGDSTESDAKIYAAIIKRYPQQVNKILIRNVQGDRDTQFYSELFQGVDQDKWLIFSSASELGNIKL